MYYVLYTGLEIGSVTLQNTNHFCCNFKSLWLSESQNCESLLADLRIIFQMVSPKDLFLDEISPFLDTCYVHDTKMQIPCEL